MADENNDGAGLLRKLKIAKRCLCGAFTASNRTQTHSTEKTELLNIVKNNLEKEKKSKSQ